MITKASKVVEKEKAPPKASFGAPTGNRIQEAVVAKDATKAEDSGVGLSMEKMTVARTIHCIMLL